MPSLSNPALSINLVAGTSNRKVTGSVKVTFSPIEKALILLFAPAGVSLKWSLGCQIWGEDGGVFTGEHDLLFSIKSQAVSADGTHTFTKTVSTSVLDEDDNIGNDEIFAKFTCNPPADSGLTLTAATSVKSKTISGDF
jgi:hypothetical protein